MTKLEAHLKQKNESLEYEKETLEEENIRLKEELRMLRKSLFGPKSERVIANPDDQPDLEGFDLEPTSEDAQDEVLPVAEVMPVKRRKQKHVFTIPEDLPREEVHCGPTADMIVCPVSKRPMKKIGEERSEKLAFKPAQYFVKVRVVNKYASLDPTMPGVLQAKLPDLPIENCRADVTLLAQILIQKYVDHLPLYRVEQIMQRAGIHIQRQTLSGWVKQLAKALIPIYEEMYDRIVHSDRIFTDGTSINYLTKGQGSKKGQMYVYCGGETDDKFPPYLLYHFTEDKQDRHPLTMLSPFSGSLHSDAFSAYEKLAQSDSITWQPCLAHARRKFIDAGGPKEISDRIIELFRQIFMNERDAWNEERDERLKNRQQKQKPLMDELYRIIDDQVENHCQLPKQMFTKALMYIYKRKGYFNNFLDDPDIVIDNNLAERTIKPLVIGRKNWLFLGAKTAGNSTAVILSLVQTCKHLGIDPYAYLEDVLARIMSHNSQKIYELLPDFWAAEQNNG